MAVLVCDKTIADKLIQQRKKAGLDRFDEVWDGVYVMSPAANNEHQSLASEFGAILKTLIDWRNIGLTVIAANVSDRQDRWTENYRVPDVLVFSKNTAAIDRKSHWFGGPELAIEIVSPGDKTFEKLDFYAAVKTQELLVIERHPWNLTVFRFDPTCNRMDRTTDSSVNTFVSRIFPIQILFDEQAMQLQVRNADGKLVHSIAIEE